MNFQQYILYYDMLLAWLKAMGISIPLPPIPVMAAKSGEPAPPSIPPLTAEQQTDLGQHLLAAHIVFKVFGSG